MFCVPTLRNSDPVSVNIDPLFPLSESKVRALVAGRTVAWFMFGSPELVRAIRPPFDPYAVNLINLVYNLMEKADVAA